MMSAAAVITMWSVTPVRGASADPAAGFPSDEHGYLNTAAHCDDGQTALLYGRTARALVAVCVGPDGQLQYRGVRLSDRAGLVTGASRGADGAVIASNDDVTYAISPAAFLVSQGDTVLYRDTWEEFHQPGSPAGSTASSPPPSSAPSTTGAPSSTPSPTTTTPPTKNPTVSTTTVTPTPSKASGG